MIFYISFHTSNHKTHHKTYKPLSNKYNLEQNTSIFSSIAHGFLKILTAEMVNDLTDTHHIPSTFLYKTSK